MDTLIPAQIAYSEAVEKDARFTDALQAMVSAAQQGQQSTHDLIAKLGRASRLGERSRGHLDAGATSCYLILNAIAEAIIQKSGS